jgi:aldehyde:ferredoxin oxidoreductase
MVDQYYYVRKWDENGVPQQELLDELKINFTIHGGA